MSSWLRREAEAFTTDGRDGPAEFLQREQFGLLVLAEVERRLAQSCDCDECSSGKKGALDVVRLLREG